MSRKQTIQSRIMKVQKMYSTLQAELKEIQTAERIERRKQVYKDFTMKVWVDTAVADKPVAIEESDYAHMEQSSLGFPIVRFEHGTFILLKSEDELPRYKTLIDRLSAARQLFAVQEKKAELTADKIAELQKTILGEVEPLPPMVD